MADIPSIEAKLLEKIDALADRLDTAMGEEPEQIATVIHKLSLAVDTLHNTHRLGSR